MRITLDYTKSLEENASDYFEKAKIAKRKAERVKELIIENNSKLRSLEILHAAEQVHTNERKKEWYEKFRWFFTSENHLVIGGRDATSNEIVIKKRTEPSDTVFHTEMAGSPFVVLKVQNPSSQELQETAIFTATYSKAWKLGMTESDVFYVTPQQVTKETRAGEYISKGAFMIYGKKTIIKAKLELYVGKMNDGKIMAGPKSAVVKNCENYFQVIQGREKLSNVGKQIKKLLGAPDLDEIIRVLPLGCKLK